MKYYKTTRRTARQLSAAAWRRKLGITQAQLDAPITPTTGHGTKYLNGWAVDEDTGACELEIKADDEKHYTATQRSKMTKTRSVSITRGTLQ